MALKKSAAPAILHVMSRALRSAHIGADIKDRLWNFSQRYATYFDISTEASITNGMKMQVHSKPRVEQEIFLFGEWEPLFTRHLQSIPANDGIFLDVGANIGYFSLIASRIFSAVHAIEASPSTARRLKHNIAANRIDNITVYETAVGAEEGHIDFYQDNKQSGAASTIKTATNEFEARVPVGPLEKILNAIDWHRVRFVKIDVEGVEAPVLDSLYRLRDTLHPDIEIFVEYDPQRADTWPSIEPFLASGFACAVLQGPYDLRDYVEQGRRSAMEPINDQPGMFCDLLLRRTRGVTRGA